MYTVRIQHDRNIIQLQMLEQLSVELEYPYTANCSKCKIILFEIRLIDQFVRCKAQKQSTTKSRDGAKFYMLHLQLIPSTISISKTSYLNKQKPFNMQFLGQVTCVSCKQVIGLKILTVSSDFHHPQLLNRILIRTDKVTIRTHKQDVTKQLLERFYQEWENQTQIDQPEFINSFSKINNKDNDKNDKDKDKQKQKQKNNKQQTKAQHKQKQATKKPKQQIKQQKIQQQSKHLRKQIEQQAQQNKQVIEEIVSSIDFFNEILMTLQKRVTQAENVCNVLKDRVEKIIPLLRKKKDN